jgi:hypothetical protein
VAKSEKQSFDEVQRLAAAGQTAEARALFEVLRATALNEPNEITTRSNGDIVFKRRGKIVIQDADGIWQLASPSQKATRQKRTK